MTPRGGAKRESRRSVRTLSSILVTPVLFAFLSLASASLSPLRAPASLGGYENGARNVGGLSAPRSLSGDACGWERWRPRGGLRENSRSS